MTDFDPYFAAVPQEDLLGPYRVRGTDLSHQMVVGSGRRAIQALRY
jgi:hypothetical protein